MTELTLTLAPDSAISEDLVNGRPFVIVDAEDESGRVMLVCAAERATTETVAFVIRHGSGFVTVGLPADRCRVLGLCPMVHGAGKIASGTADFTVAVDAAAGITTGISATDRATTIRGLADESLGFTDFVRPGHVMVVGLADSATISYPYVRELSNLIDAAGLFPAAAFADLVSVRDETRMAGAQEARRFADQYGLSVISIQDIAAMAR